MTLPLTGYRPDLPTFGFSFTRETGRLTARRKGTDCPLPKYGVCRPLDTERRWGEVETGERTDLADEYKRWNAWHSGQRVPPLPSDIERHHAILTGGA